MAAVIGVHGTPYGSVAKGSLGSHIVCGEAAVPGRPLFRRALKARTTEFFLF
jgi:hypothetical protein